VAVRVKIKLNFKKKSLITVAVANAGFESDEDELLIPLPVALKLGMEKAMRKAKRESYKAVGRYIEMIKVPTKTKINVITNDKVSSPIKCTTIISETEDEVIINDKSIGDLEIVIENAGEGLWRFRHDPIERLRESEEPVRW
jgi:hypothetical protein